MEMSRIDNQPFLFRIFEEFLAESRELLQDLQNRLRALPWSGFNKALLVPIYRGFHVLSGVSDFLDRRRMQTLFGVAVDALNQALYWRL